MSKKQLAKSKLSGGERAAIYLMTLGEDEAASVLRHLGPREVQKLGTAMTALKNVSREQVNEVLTEFVRTVSEHTALRSEERRVGKEWSTRWAAQSETTKRNVLAHSGRTGSDTASS